MSETEKEKERVRQKYVNLSDQDLLKLIREMYGELARRDRSGRNIKTVNTGRIV